jgi:hypothetical protein
MTDLSPAAQAVFSAWAKPVAVDRSLVISGRALEHQARSAIAAELEGDGPAVSADREPASVVPEPTDKELCETYVAAYYAAKDRQGPASQAAGLRAVLQKWGAQ